MLFLKLLLAAYIVCAMLTFLMVNAAIDHKIFRRIFLLLGLVMPFIFLYAAVVSLFSSREVIPYDEEIGAIEDRIETERVRLFGGEITCPSFSDRWKLAYEAYIEKLVQRAAKTSKAIASLPILAGRI
jgi:hypothetical protein